MGRTSNQDTSTRYDVNAQEGARTDSRKSIALSLFTDYYALTHNGGDIQNVVSLLLPKIPMDSASRTEIERFLQHLSDNSPYSPAQYDAISKIIDMFLTSQDMFTVRLAAILETMVARDKLTRISAAVMQRNEEHTRRLLALVHQCDQLDARINEIEQEAKNHNHDTRQELELARSTFS